MNTYQETHGLLNCVFKALFVDSFGKLGRNFEGHDSLVYRALWLDPVLRGEHPGVDDLEVNLVQLYILRYQLRFGEVEVDLHVVVAPFQQSQVILVQSLHLLFVDFFDKQQESLENVSIDVYIGKTVQVRDGVFLKASGLGGCRALQSFHGFFHPRLLLLNDLFDERWQNQWLIELDATVSVSVDFDNLEPHWWRYKVLFRFDDFLIIFFFFRGNEGREINFDFLLLSLLFLSWRLIFFLFCWNCFWLLLGLSLDFFLSFDFFRDVFLLN